MQPNTPNWHFCSYVIALLQFFIVPPRRMFGILVVAALCSWVSPGNRCALKCGVDSHLGLLAFQRPSYNFICCLSSVIINASLSKVALPLPVSSGLQIFVVYSVPSALFSMPILRQRMGCRRGGSRGRPICQPSSSTKDSSSCSSRFGSDRHPTTRRGRGRGRGQYVLQSSSHNIHAHMARFQIPCTLSDHSFIASVTIQLSKGTVGLVSATLDATTETREKESPGTSQFHSQQNKALGGSASQVMSTRESRGVLIEGGSPSEEGHPSYDDYSSSFGCRIIKKTPSTAQDA